MAHDNSIVITGMGLVTPAGCSLEALWRVLRTGASTAARLEDLDRHKLRVRFGCKVRGLEDCDVVPQSEARRMDPFAHYALTAAIAAWSDAGWPSPPSPRGAIVVGNSVGGQQTSSAQARSFFESGPSKVHPRLAPMTMPNAAVALIAMRLGWQGPTMTISAACSSGAQAIGEAMHLLRAGRADLVLAGGTEAMLTPFSVAGFASLQALSMRNDEPERASRPFDADRDGFVLGEGAAFVVLERQRAARSRGAVPYATLAGYATNADAHSLVMPAYDGAGAAACMSAAIADAGLEPMNIVHINAHGTSTRLNDRAEARAIQTVFGPSAPPVTATKGAVGHLIGAAGAVELVASVLALCHGSIPPTANHERLDRDMTLDVVHGECRSVPAGPVLCNSFAFGGHNSCLVVTPP